jgi:hypothetical protein
MPTDKYTRVVLSIIAACLVWLCANTIGQPVNAQRAGLSSDAAQPVVIVGWGTMDSRGAITLTMNRDRTTDPRIPVNVMDAVPLDVRLEDTDARPLPIGISRIKQAGEDWEPIRSAVEEEPVRPKPGRRQ